MCVFCLSGQPSGCICVSTHLKLWLPFERLEHCQHFHCPLQEQIEKGPPISMSQTSCPDEEKSQCRFRPGMRLEALDRKHPTIICVATVQDVQSHQLQIHFDGWSNTYDYWCECKSSDIHPISYCERAGLKLQPPKGEVFHWLNLMSPADSVHVGIVVCLTDTVFVGWPKYLKSVGALAAPESLFEPVRILCWMMGIINWLAWVMPCLRVNVFLVKLHRKFNKASWKEWNWRLLIVIILLSSV